jgi:hypothetical protein
MAGVEKPNDEFGIRGYEVPNPSLRFNFQNKEYKIPASLKNTYIDDIFKKKALLPSPDRYECNAHRK